MSEPSPIEQSTPAQVTGSSVPNVQNPSHPSFRRYAQSLALSHHRRAFALTSMMRVDNEQVARVVSFPSNRNRPSTEAPTIIVFLMDLENLGKS